jgi:hypothetical protein
MWYLASIDKVPDCLLQGHTFIIGDGPCVIIRVSAGQVLQIGRDKDAAPCTIVLTAGRKLCVCVFLLTACRNTPRLSGWWWWCRVLKFYDSLANNWSEMIEINR